MKTKLVFKFFSFLLLLTFLIGNAFSAQSHLQMAEKKVCTSSTTSHDENKKQNTDTSNSSDCEKCLALCVTGQVVTQEAAANLPPYQHHSNISYAYLNLYSSISILPEGPPPKFILA